MAKFTVGKGINEYIAELEKISQLTPDMIGRSIYEGAKVVTDAIRSEINGLTEQDVTPVQKEGLLNGLGIANLKQNLTSSDVKVGMDGYNTHITKKYPNGHPNMMIARSVISGTSFHPRKNDFMSRATRASKAQAEKAMKDEFDNQLKKYV